MFAERAKTTYPNTPESDKQRFVLHDVYLSNGLITRTMAECPIDAINKVNEAIKNHQTVAIV